MTIKYQDRRGAWWFLCNICMDKAPKSVDITKPLETTNEPCDICGVAAARADRSSPTSSQSNKGDPKGGYYK